MELRVLNYFLTVAWEKKMALLNLNFCSECLKRKVPVTVVLPVEQTMQIGIQGTVREDTAQKFKTLYLLHGLTDDNSFWLSNTAIEP